MAKERTIDPGRFNFIGVSVYFLAISIILVIASLVCIFTRSFNYGIDFAGGTEMQVQFSEPMNSSDVRNFTNKLGFSDASVQALGNGNEYLVRVETLLGKTEKETSELNMGVVKKISDGFLEQYKNKGVNIRSVESVGPQVGDELRRNGILAAFYSLLIILIYIGFRFDYKYGVGAVFCLFHDAIITLGVYSIFWREVNVQTLAAILTLIGYSLNDTIVTFDRIRENLNIPGLREKPFTFVVNRSINDVLSRTILTHVTTSMTVLSMMLLATGVIEDFAVTMMIGIVIGSYSTVYVASPLVILAEKFQHRSKA